MAYHSPPAVWSRCLWALLLSSGLLLGVLRGSSDAQITLDGSLGPPGPLTGPDYRIGAELGQLRGSNLFHSFGAFNVPTGGSATFTGPPTIANILSRVTGGQPSAIDGLLRSEIAGANLFLLNPSGVLFGPNASLDVRGSFHVSTADFLRFADGAKFSANLGQESMLTVAPPTAFGFLGSNPAGLTIQGGSLKVSEGKALSVVGGDVTILGNNGPLTGDSVPTLHAPSGRVQLASVASPGEVGFSRLDLAPDLQVDGFARLGRIELSRSAFLDASGNGGGSVLLRSGRLRVDGSWMFADNTGPIHGAGVGLDLRIGADAVLTNGARLTTDSLGAGHARDLRLTAGRLSMDHAVIASNPSMSGNSGNLGVNVGTLTLTNGAQIDSGTRPRSMGRGGDLTVTATEAITIAGQDQAGTLSGLFSSTEGQGDAGRLSIFAPSLTLMDGGRISTSTLGDGHAGNLEVQVERLTLMGGAQISSSSGATQFIDGVPTFIGGQGRGGDLTVVATESISIAGRDGEFRSGLFSTADGSGDAGSLLVSTPLLSMDEGRILGRTLGGGNAGRIEVKTGRLTLTGGAQIFSGIGTIEAGVVRGTQGPGRGGNVTVHATDSIFITGRDRDGFFSTIASNAQIGQGRAGDLLLSTPRLEMRDGFISTGTSSQSTGDAGNIDLGVGRLTLTGGAQIRSSTSGPGRGGTLTVAASEAITISGQNQTGTLSGLFSNTQGRGQGGSIQAQARTIEISDGGTVSASSTGDGPAGTLLLQAGETFRSQGGHVTTAADRAGGGRIELHAGQLIQLIDSELTTTVQGGGGDAGNLTLDSQFVVAEGSQIIANAFAGMGGNIRLGAEVFLADPASQVSASSTLGIQGTVNIQAPVTSLSGTLAPLPQAFVNVAALLPARCAARLSGGQVSSLVLGGRDGLPVDPGGLLPSPLTLDERLVGDPRVTAGPHQQPSTTKFAFLTGADKAFPRLRGDQWAGKCPKAM
jgi:filamentous hemagglutinin family protein